MYYKRNTQRNDRVVILSYMYRPKTFILWKQCGILDISVKRGEGQQKWVHPLYFLTLKRYCFQYFVCPPLFLSTAAILLGIELASVPHVFAGILFHSSAMTCRSCVMLDTFRPSTFHFRMPHRYSIGYRSGGMLGHSNTFTFNFFRKAVVCLERCFGSLSCSQGG